MKKLNLLRAVKTQILSLETGVLVLAKKKLGLTVSKLVHLPVRAPVETD